MTVTVGKIKKAVDNPHFDMWKVTGREGGYWVMQYDDVDRNIFVNESFMVMYLKNLPLDVWVEYGKRFVKQVEGDI